MELIICKICNKEFKSITSLSRHLKSHKISSKDYYDKHSNSGKSSEQCLICGGKCLFSSLSCGYNKYCSTQCGKKAISTKVKSYIKSRTQQQRISIADKKRLAMKRFYNDANADVRDASIASRKLTNIVKYGTQNVASSKEIQTKIKQTNIERYGVQNVFANEEIKSKIKQTNIERYGVQNVFANEEIKSKIKQTNIHKWGFPHPMQSKLIQSKRAKTCLAKYGCEYPMQNEQIWIKASSNSKRSNAIKTYICKNGTIVHYQSLCELEFITSCQNLGYNIIDGKRIPYTINNEVHWYIPDFKIIYPDNNVRIIQIKSLNSWYHTEQVKTGVFNAKCQAARLYSRDKGYRPYTVIFY